jgi:hypothetical protein
LRHTSIPFCSGSNYVLKALPLNTAAFGIEFHHEFWWGHTIAWPVARACNPSCSEGRDQEDPGSKPVRDKEFARSYLKKKKKKTQYKKSNDFLGLGL